MLEFSVKSFRHAQEYCQKNIGPRRYWLHTSIGGDGWSINQKNGEIVVSIEDDKKALLAVLSMKEI